MFRKHVSLLVGLCLVLFVVTACIVRTHPSHRRGGPAYREQRKEHRKDHRKDHRKNHRKNNRGRWSRFDEAPTPVQQMTQPRSNGLADQ